MLRRGRDLSGVEFVVNRVQEWVTAESGKCDWIPT